MCIDQTYCYLSEIPLRVFLQSLFIMYRNGPPSCTEVVQADSARSLCAEIGLYRSHPPRCPEVVMYRTGPNPNTIHQVVKICLHRFDRAKLNYAGEAATFKQLCCNLLSMPTKTADIRQF